MCFFTLEDLFLFMNFNPSMFSILLCVIECFMKPIISFEHGGSLFVGSAVDAADSLLLKKHGVKRIVNVAKEIRCFHAEFEYLHLELDDDPDEPIERVFEEVCKFIEEAKRGDSVFVHCQAGISRSVTVCIAFLILRRKMSLRDAYLIVKEARPIAGPNIGFWKSLQQLDGAGEFSLHEYLVLALEEMGFEKEKAEAEMTRFRDDFDSALRALIRDQMAE